MSVGSKEGFLSRGWMITCVCESGKRPYVNDALASSVKTGASASHNSLTTTLVSGRVHTSSRSMPILAHNENYFL